MNSGRRSFLGQIIAAAFAPFAPAGTAASDHGQRPQPAAFAKFAAGHANIPIDAATGQGAAFVAFAAPFKVVPVVVVAPANVDNRPPLPDGACITADVTGEAANGFVVTVDAAGRSVVRVGYVAALA